MNSNDENQRNSLFSQLIRLAQTDGEVDFKEFQFLLTLALQMGMDKDELKILFEEHIDFHPPRIEYERIVQFQRLILMMNVDLEIDEKEMEYVRDLGFRMGLHQHAIEEILNVMNNYPNKVVPPEKLIQIFSTYHN